ncbi:MAG: hypothetical protein KAR13_10285, partial [Desulfobulbaceae bacterium]|nr:hypothetical protein [Desulfobulbaceae bacterium]
MQVIIIFANNNEFGEHIIFSHIDQSLSPERAVFDSPGCTRVKKITSCQALKGRYKTNVDYGPHLYIALSGLDFWLFRTPGRCPGLWDIALTGL